MKSDRYKNIVLCLQNYLPFEIIEIILSIITIEEAKIINKLTEMFAKMYYDFNKFTSNLECVKFYNFCVTFANEHNLTSTEFDNWFDSGLLIGWIGKNKGQYIYVYESPKAGEKHNCSQIFKILDHCSRSNLGQYSLLNNDHRYKPVGKYILSYQHCSFISSVLDLSQWYHSDRYSVNRYHDATPNFETLQQFSKRELYRYQRLESNFKKSKMQQPLKKQNRSLKNR